MVDWPTTCVTRPDPAWDLLSRSISRRLLVETEAHEAFIFSSQASVSDQGVEEEADDLGSVPPSLPSHNPSSCGKSVCLTPSLSAPLSPIPSHDPTSQEDISSALQTLVTQNATSQHQGTLFLSRQNLSRCCSLFSPLGTAQPSTVTSSF